MTIKKIVLCTDIKGFKKKFTRALKKTGVPVERCKTLPEDPDDLLLNPDYLYVFAFSKCSEEMLGFMAKHSECSNILTLLCRPNNGVLSQESDEMLGKITLLSPERIVPHALRKTRETIKIFGCKAH